jgi:hypothetical protein
MMRAHLTPTACNSRLSTVGAELNEIADYFEGQQAPAYPKVFSTLKGVGAGSELCIWVRNPHGTFFEIGSFAPDEIDSMTHSDEEAAVLIVEFADHRLSELQG